MYFPLRLRKHNQSHIIYFSTTIRNMRIGDLSFVLGAVAITASPIPHEEGPVQIGIETTSDNGYSNSALESGTNSGNTLTELEDNLRAIVPRAPVPTIAPTLDWDLEVDDVDDQTAEDLMSEGDVNDFKNQNKKPKKPKKPKKSKKPKTKTKFRTKTRTETETETVTLPVPAPPEPTSNYSLSFC